MNEVIELHDSLLVAITTSPGSTSLSLQPAHLHRSFGRAAVDTGTCWLQSATLTITTETISPAVELPSTISDGSLLIEDRLFENCIPTSGTFLGPIELRLVFTNSETLILRGDQITIALHGDATYLQDFQP